MIRRLLAIVLAFTIGVTLGFAARPISGHLRIQAVRNLASDIVALAPSDPEASLVKGQNYDKRIRSLLADGHYQHYTTVGGGDWGEWEKRIDSAKSEVFQGATFADLHFSLMVLGQSQDVILVEALGTPSEIDRIKEILEPLANNRVDSDTG